MVIVRRLVFFGGGAIGTVRTAWFPPESPETRFRPEGVDGDVWTEIMNNVEMEGEYFEVQQ